MPLQEGQTDVGAVPPQEGPLHTTVRAGMSSSVARASLLALYTFYDPPQVPSARVLPERDPPQALARALVTYGAAARTTWLLEDDSRISTDEAQLPAGGTPGHVPSISSEFWYSREASSDASAIGSALKIPPAAKVWIGGDSSLRLYAVGAEGKATGGKQATRSAIGKQMLELHNHIKYCVGCHP